MVSPDSEVFCGMDWMQDLQQAQEDNILTSARTILDKNVQLNEKDQKEYNKAFKSIPKMTAGRSIKLINEGGVTAWETK